MTIVIAEQAWEDYLYWEAQDAKLLERINSLIKKCRRTPFTGSDKPEPLRGDLRDWWSRRITLEHLFVYRMECESLLIAQCRYHY